MAHHFFAIPALNLAAAHAEFNHFCQQHRVVQVDSQFINGSIDSHSALCVQVANGPDRLPPALKVLRPGDAPC